MQLHSIIIDDDEACRTALIQLINQADGLKLTGSYSNAKEAGSTLKKPETHLVFLDVEMPGISGLDLLAGAEIKPLVILTTSHSKYAIDSYQYGVVDYLLKPITLDRFLKAVSKAEKQFENSFFQSKPNDWDYFFIRKGSEIHKVPIADTLWIEALGDYVIVQTRTIKYILHSTMRSIESRLPSKFIRVHRSYIVQVENIRSIVDSCIFITDKPIPLSNLYKANFLKRIEVLG